MSNLPSLNDTTFDKIWAYYKSPDKIKLTPKQEEIKDRWLSIFSLRLNFHSRQQTITAYREQWSQKDVEISLSQAYKDLANSERLFGDVHKADRQASLAVLSEYAHKLFLMAMKNKDGKTAASALKLMGEYQEVNRIDAINFNPKKLEDKPDHYSVPKVVLEAITKHMNAGVVDFNNLTVEEVEFETINTDGEEEE